MVGVCQPATDLLLRPGTWRGGWEEPQVVQHCRRPSSSVASTAAAIGLFNSARRSTVIVTPVGQRWIRNRAQGIPRGVGIVSPRSRCGIDRHEESSARASQRAMHTDLNLLLRGDRTSLSGRGLQLELRLGSKTTGPAPVDRAFVPNPDLRARFQVLPSTRGTANLPGRFFGWLFLVGPRLRTSFPPPDIPTGMPARYVGKICRSRLDMPPLPAARPRAWGHPRGGAWAR